MAAEAEPPTSRAPSLPVITRAAPAESPKVFISYSRRDEAFAQELLSGLRLAGFEPYLDKHDIAAGEEWETRLGRLIDTADTVVFVISPEAVTSDRCAWEVERAVLLKKRVLPVVWRRVEEKEVPDALKQLNYIFFDQPLSFAASLTALVVALKTDIDWIREHTRIGEAALRWDVRGRAEALLFRGEELTSAKAWLASQPRFAPEPSLLHHEFIKSSVDAQGARESVERKTIDDMRAALNREMAAQAEREMALQRERHALNRIRRAQVAVGTLFVSIVLMGLVWRSQDYLQEQYHWRFTMRPTVLTAAQESASAAVPGPGSAFKECMHGCPTMIVLPLGKFTMGSPAAEPDRDDDEGPQRVIAITKSLAVGRTEVTFDEFDACVSAGACKRPPDSGFGRGAQPVINVSWDEARAYTAWLSRLTGKEYRLLTEAEWEYSARAGSETVFAWGNEPGEGNANCDGCKSQWAGKQTAPVGSFKPNAFGLHDMHGNVFEWVEDCYGPYGQAPLDGTPATAPNCSARVVRGGSWFGNPGVMRAANRLRVEPDLRFNSRGFRVARTISK